MNAPLKYVVGFSVLPVLFGVLYGISRTPNNFIPIVILFMTIGFLVLGDLSQKGER